jgi:hypothetical protein
MTILILKHYQERSLEVLKQYLRRATAPSSSAKRAFIEITERPYQIGRASCRERV